ncbi:molybdopterin-binding protein [Pseudomonadota bacterium]
MRLSTANVMARSGVFAKVETGGEAGLNDSIDVLELVPRNQFQVAVITVSDRCAAGEAVDTAGPAVTHLLETSLQAHIHQTEIVPDDRQTIADRLAHYSDERSIDLIITAARSNALCFVGQDAHRHVVAWRLWDT